MTAFSVNLNKIALLRNSRGRNYPDITFFAKYILGLGADGVTIHPRPDQRHAKYEDIALLQEICIKERSELNIEGYPNEMLISKCIDNKVAQVTLVPDLPDQITSDHGWTISQNKDLLIDVISELKRNNIRSSLFMDPNLNQIEQAAKTGVDRIELHTEYYARSYEDKKHIEVIKLFIKANIFAKECGMQVNAGHDLNLSNLGFFLEYVPVSEVSIGHALTVESIINGLDDTVRKYISICHT